MTPSAVSLDELSLYRISPWSASSGPQLQALFQAGRAWLEANHQLINDLNIFPVPDGDSGTNMLLTLQSACTEIDRAPSMVAGDVMQAVAHGALMGARGNSGVILSQLFRGMADTLTGRESFTAGEFAAALQAGSELAYLAVQKPVEGTILTVAREMAGAAAEAAQMSDDLRYVLTASVAEAQRSVARTPQLFPLLAKAGVVDAGAQGLFIIWQGALKLVNGEHIEPAVESARHANVNELTIPDGWGFDIQCILRGSALDVDAIRCRIEAMGESVLVVGDTTMIKVHAHAPTPGPILDYCVSSGSVSRVIIENMEVQYQEIRLAQARPPIAAETISGIATVVVASGAGIQRVFESLGTSRLVSGGATMNPSVQDLLSAIENAAAENVIVLPNEKNIMLAARQAARLSRKAVRIVPSLTVPQGIAALLAFNFQADLDSNAEMMTRALGNVETGEITRAVRTVSIDGLNVQAGQVIGLLNGSLCVAGSAYHTVAVEVMQKMRIAECEIASIYYGADVTPAAAGELAAAVRRAFPQLEVDVHSGGQAHAHYIISAE
jgi:uncharacterized protein